jgi:phage tail protein X
MNDTFHQPDDDELWAIERYLEEEDVKPLDDVAARLLAKKMLVRFDGRGEPTRARSQPATPAASCFGPLLNSIAAQGRGYALTFIAISACVWFEHRVRRDLAEARTIAAAPIRLGAPQTARPTGPSAPTNEQPQIAPSKIIVANSTVPGSLSKYTVQPGDTLTGIAVHHYGSALEWRAILNVNPGLVPEKLRPGKTIFLPDMAGKPPRMTSMADSSPQIASATRKRSYGR